MADIKEQESMDVVVERIKDAFKAHAIELFERDGFIVPAFVIGKWDEKAGFFRYALIISGTGGGGCGDEKNIEQDFLAMAMYHTTTLRADIVFLVGGMMGVQFDTNEEIEAAHEAMRYECASKAAAGEKPGVPIPDNAKQVVLMQFEAPGLRYFSVMSVVLDEKGNMSLEKGKAREWIGGECDDREGGDSPLNSMNLRLLPGVDETVA